MKIRVIQNDRSTSYYTSDTVAHLFEVGKSTTLCGVRWRGWLSHPDDTVGAALFCVRCERSAKKRGIEIPY